MKALITLASLCVLLAPALAQDYGLLLDQPYYDGGWAVGSLVDPSAGFDWQSADDFVDLAAPIQRIVIYGFSVVYVDEHWEPVDPAVTEPFILRFYEREIDLAPGLHAPSSGQYTIELYDDYADGWNGGRLDVLVNGTVVLSEITLDDGAGPASFPLIVSAGDEISTIYTPGEWSFENYYRILDGFGTPIAEDGGTMTDMGSYAPTGILPAGAEIVREPEWDAPTLTLNVEATTALAGTAWAWPLHSFAFELPVAVDLQDGWISAQIDVPLGSGVGFFWLNSQVGNGLAYLWDPNAARGASLAGLLEREGKPARRDGRAGTRGGDRLAFDLALELWEGGIVAIEGGNDRPELPLAVTRLEGPQPNPFNPMTVVSFSLASAQHVKLSIHDVAGRQVAVLANDHFGAGDQSVVWNGTDGEGRGVPSGTYLVFMETGERILTRKMLLVR